MEEYKQFHKEKKRKIDEEKSSRFRTHETTKPLENIYSRKGELQKINQFDEKVFTN